MLIDHGNNETDAVLKITDGVTGIGASVLVPRPALRIAVRDLVSAYLLDEAKDERLVERSQLKPEGLRSLRKISDLCCDWDVRGLQGAVFPEIGYVQSGEPVDPDAPPKVETLDVNGQSVDLADLTVDRSDAGYRRHWTGFQARRWRRDAAAYETFVVDCLRNVSDDGGVDDVLRLDTPDRVRALVAAVSLAVWTAPFENYSRFLDAGQRFKTGDETLLGIMAGNGGICTEKVQAVRFITDHYGIRAEYLLGGADASPPLPEARLRELLDAFDFRFARRHMRYWQHAALLYWIDEEPMMVDATNGNIPYLCRRGDDARRLLGENGLPAESLPVRMMGETEQWHYHRVEQSIPLDLFVALEGYLDDADLVQVFDNDLGLFLSRRFFVTPLPHTDSDDYLRTVAHYEEYCRNAGFRMSADLDWELALETPLGEEFALDEGGAAAGILAAQEKLLERYRWREGPEYRLGLAVVERTSDPLFQRSIST